MPSKSDLKSRTSTITNAFAIAITPYIKPKNIELNEYYKSLKIKPGVCAYCLQKANSSDHYHALVKNQKPTGYITDISNLIPCCSSCNSSKGSTKFEDWYYSAKNIKRLRSLGLSDEIIKDRYDTIINHFKKYGKSPVNYERILGKELWDEYQERKAKLMETLKDNQKFCDKLLKIIVDNIKSK